VPLPVELPSSLPPSSKHTLLHPSTLSLPHCRPAWLPVLPVLIIVCMFRVSALAAVAVARFYTWCVWQMPSCGVYSLGLVLVWPVFVQVSLRIKRSSVYLVHLVWRVPLSVESIHCNKPPPRIQQVNQRCKNPLKQTFPHNFSHPPTPPVLPPSNPHLYPPPSPPSSPPSPTCVRVQLHHHV